MNALLDFFQNTVKSRAWENGGEVVKLLDGTEKISVANEIFQYTDTWYDQGTEFFAGREEIRSKGKLVWCRNYEGTAFPTEDISIKDIWKFLKEALSHHEDTMGQRGPDYYESNAIKEWNSWYRLYYYGRQIEPDLFIETIRKDHQLIYQGIYSVR